MGRERSLSSLFYFMTIDICKHCKKEFIKNRKDKIFCSSKCKVRAKNKRLGKYQPSSYNRKYIIFKKDVCDFCGFVPVNPCQLDVDHIDGDHKNNSPSNLQTLCANCHRLKTYLNKDWESKQKPIN